jgi:hypothetical protein
MMNYKVTIYRGNEVINTLYFNTYGAAESYINNNVTSEYEAYISKE